MKRFYTIVISFIALITLTACSSDNKVEKNSTDSSVSQKFYTVKVTNIKPEESDWVIEGTTDAPDESQVVAVTKDDDIQLLEDDAGDVPTVKDGKISATIDTSLTDIDGKHDGDKVNVYILAASPDNVSDTDGNEIKDKYVSEIEKDKFKQTLTYIKKQIDYYDSLDDDSGDSNEDVDDSSSDNDLGDESDSSEEASSDEDYDTDGTSSESDTDSIASRDVEESINDESSSSTEEVSSTQEGDWTVAGPGMVFVSDSNLYYSRVKNPGNFQYVSQQDADSSGAHRAPRGNEYARP